MRYNIKNMFKKITRNIFSDFFDHIITLRSMEYLSPLINNWSYLPVTNWSAGPYFYSHIFNDIIIYNRKNIVELGSGISTILLARLAKLNNIDLKIISIDQDSIWQNTIYKCLESDKTTQFVEFIYSPISQYKNYNWYCKNDIIMKNTIDLLIVDGPKCITPLDRKEAIPFFKHLLSHKSYSIFLHDTDRSGEKIIVNLWKNELKNVKLSIMNRYSLFEYNNNYASTPQTSI